MKYLKSLFVLLYLLICSSLFAQDIDLEKIREAGHLYFYDYMEKNNISALDKSIKIFEEIKEDTSDIDIITILLGRLYIAKGKSCFWVWNKFRWTKIGMKLLEKTIKDVHDNQVLVLFEYAKENSRLPSFFNKTEEAIRYFNLAANSLEKDNIKIFYDEWSIWQAFHCTNTIKADTQESEMREYLMQMNYYWLGKAYLKNNQFELAWDIMEKTYRINKNSMYGVHSRIWFKIQKKNQKFGKFLW